MRGNDGTYPEGDNPWDMLGRGSSAGRALYALYAGDLSGKDAGNKFSQRNRDRFVKQLQTVNRSMQAVEPKPKKVPKSRAQVTVPKFTKKKKSTTQGNVSPKGGKKPANVIKHELNVLEEELRTEIPQPSRTLIGDREKQRYATLLEWNGNPPPKNPNYVPKKTKRGMTQKEELRQLFDATMNEIEERRAFLTEMREGGKAEGYEQQIKAEIQTRIADLRKIDDLMQKAEDG